VVTSTLHLLRMLSVQESQSVVARSGLLGVVLSHRAGLTRTDAQRRGVCESCLSTHTAAAPTRSAVAPLAASRIFAHHLVLQVYRLGPHQMPALLHTHTPTPVSRAHVILLASVGPQDSESLETSNNQVNGQPGRVSGAQKHRSCVFELPGAQTSSQTGQREMHNRQQAASGRTHLFRLFPARSRNQVVCSGLFPELEIGLECLHKFFPRYKPVRVLIHCLEDLERTRNIQRGLSVTL
jgi:hypothetical protein